MLKTHRELWFELSHHAIDFFRYVQRVCPGLQKYPQQHRFFAIDGAVKVVILGSELNSRNVFKAQAAAVGIRADNNILEFLWLRHAPACGDTINQRLR